MNARHVLVLADGDVDDEPAIDLAWPGWSEGIDHVIAADGGARHAATVGRRVDRWVGDGDSIDPGLRASLVAAGVPIEVASVEKDETDTELALLAAAATGADRITVLGALGGPRVDHELGNLWLLAHPVAAARDVRLVSARARIRLAGAGRVALDGRPGDGISLLPFDGRVDGITTDGLRYPLRDEPLDAGPARGLSNVRERPDASLTVRSGRLLVIETPARLPG